MFVRAASTRTGLRSRAQPPPCQLSLQTVEKCQKTFSKQRMRSPSWLRGIEDVRAVWHSVAFAIFCNYQLHICPPLLTWPCNTKEANTKTKSSAAHRKTPFLFTLVESSQSSHVRMSHQRSIAHDLPHMDHKSDGRPLLATTTLDIYIYIYTLKIYGPRLF